MLAIGLWGLDRGGIWRDEGVTFQVARRSVPQIWRLLHGVDAVHGLYYLLMHAVLAVHSDEIVLRLPSVCAAAATAGLVGALGVRLAGARVGLWAGLLYAVTPMVGHYAQEGRSYALVAAGVAGATLLLVRALDGRSWWPYALVLAATCLLHELAVLVLCAHAVTLVWTRAPKRAWWGWARATGAVGVVLLPLVLVSRAQSGQVEWLPVPGWGSAERLLRGFTAGPTGVVFWGCLMLVVLGLPVRQVAAVALPLAVVPPALLMTVSQVRPMYDDRYVLYALAGVPLLVAAGADRMVSADAGRPTMRRLLHTPAAGALAVTLAFLHALPVYRQDRTPAHRPDDLAAVSALTARQLRPGDPVVYLPSIGRRSALAYPKGFRRAWDIALGEPGPPSGTLYGREVGAGELRRRLARVHRLWVVTEPYALRSRWYPGDPTERTKLTAVEEQFVPASAQRTRYVLGGVALRLYVRRPDAFGPTVGPGAAVGLGPTAAPSPTGTPGPASNSRPTVTRGPTGKHSPAIAPALTPPTPAPASPRPEPR
nr:glycosyltransferase family 39 protein [Streptomyces pseudovenezuelae]